MSYGMPRVDPKDMVRGTGYLVQVPQGRAYLGFYQRTERGEVVLRPAEMVDVTDLILGVDEGIGMEEARIPLSTIEYISVPRKIPAW